MAKTKVLGDALVITSSVKMEDLKAVAKNRPDALTLKGGEDGKETIFRISVDEGTSGSVSKYGATFGGVSRDGSGLATITMALGTDAVDATEIKEYITDQIGGALANIAKIEEALPEVAAAIKADKAAVMETISVG